MALLLAAVRAHRELHVADAEHPGVGRGADEDRGGDEVRPRARGGQHAAPQAGHRVRVLEPRTFAKTAYLGSI